MNFKTTFFIKIIDSEQPEIFGLGECALFSGLSYDNESVYESILSQCCRNINEFTPEEYADFPSIVFGVETALADLDHGGIRTPFPSMWNDGKSVITINGLIWMGTIDVMTQRVEEKINSGFRCLKLKIGGCDFEDEMKILQAIRNRFSCDELEIRLDANGAFSPADALKKLDIISKYAIHSIEQPIKPGQFDIMANLCGQSPVNIALDEELIIPRTTEEKKQLLDFINPSYIILKPSLCGGFLGAKQWIEACPKNTLWWATSALESNIGLNAIAQWISQYKSICIPQGLGTGHLYSNNISSPLVQKQDYLAYNPEKSWKIPTLDWH